MVDIDKTKLPKENHKGMLGKKHSEVTKEKIRNAHLGMKKPWATPTPQKKEKHWKWKGGRPNCIDCGTKLQLHKAKRCRNCYCLFSSGLNNPNWRGGIDPQLYPKEFNKELKLKIRVRDNFTCCLCGRTEREELEEINRVLCVNHIDFDKDNCKESNLNTLCVRCNVKINRERDYWIAYFQSCQT